jgi:hypothetical protein
MDVLISAFFFAFGTVSCLILLYFDAKATGKPHDITLEHIRQARQCVFWCLKGPLPSFGRFA